MHQHERNLIGTSRLLSEAGRPEITTYHSDENSKRHTFTNLTDIGNDMVFESFYHYDTCHFGPDSLTDEL